MDRKVSEVPVSFLEREKIFWPEAKLQVRQLLTTHYPTDLEEYLVVSLEELAGIEMFAGDLDGEADFDLTDLMGGPVLSR